jgi:predicted RecA/RadA family phage recombinase
MSYKVGISKTIYKWTLVGINTSTGYAEAKDASGNRFAGVSSGKVVNGTTAGAYRAEVYRKGCFPFIMSGVAITDIGAEVYSTDDQTVTTSSAGSATKVGRIMDFETNIAWIDIGGYC